MSSRNFRKMLEANWSAGKFVCVGLDTDLAKIPAVVQRDTPQLAISRFNCEIIRATKDHVCAYKPNIAFYEKHGDVGLLALRETIAISHFYAPNVPVILDAKRADIGNTNEGYVASAFEYFKADAVTVNPYLGAVALEPFLSQKEKGIFVLCRTSNAGADEFQDLLVVDNHRLFERVARNVAGKWNKNGNCGVVVGATTPVELIQVRKIVGDMPILIPGVGAQGGDLEKTVLAGKNSRGQGMIINSSRGIIYASNGPDFAEVAGRETKKLHNAITQILKGEKTDV